MKTHGWDIVSACACSKINALLAERMIASPPKISYSDGSGVVIHAVLGPWEITNVGSTHKLLVKIPIVVGDMTDASKFAGFASLNLDGVSIEVSIPLAFLDNAKTQTADLTFDFKTRAFSPNDPSDGAVYCTNPDLTGKLAKLDPLGNVAEKLGERIVDALIAHRDQLSYALSSVDIAPKASWMMPKAKAHMFALGPQQPNGSPGEAYIVVVTMVRDRPANTRTMDIDPELLAREFNFSTIIAGDLFMENYVLPGIGAGFVNNPQSSFKLNGTKITGKGPIKCADYSMLGIDYTPILDQISIDIDDVNLVIKSSGKFHLTELQKSAHVSISMTKYATAIFDTAKGDIGFNEPTNPASTSDYSKHIPTGDYFIAAPLMVVLGPTIPIMIGVILDGVLVGVTNAVSRGVMNSTGAGGIGNLATVSVSWPGSTGSQVRDCGIAGNFWICGDIF